MKKNVIYFIVIVLLSFFATSCCKQKNVEIKDKDKLRFNENDMFIYKSNLGNYDTLFFEEIKSEFKYSNSSEGICSGRKVYKEEIDYYYNNYTEPFPLDSQLYLKLASLKYNNGVSYTVHTPNWLIGKPLGNYFIGDSIYENVEFVRMPVIFSVDGPYKFFYNKKYGLLSYEYRTSETYALQKYIPKAK